MKEYIFLVVTLAGAFARGPNGGQIEDIGEDKDITETNKGLTHDDILEPPNTRSAVFTKDWLWTSPVPYVLEDDLEMNAKGVILRALDQIRLKSCIDFKPRDTEDYYISVQRKEGCYSYVGRLISYGQVLSIGTGCDRISTVEHEFLHALGFYHEHNRYDRDYYVTIAFENIITGMASNFDKQYNGITQGFPYDYWSVMHYGTNTFSNGNGSTIITNFPKFQYVIGQQLDISPTDALELNLLYQCDSSIAFMMSCSFTNGDMCQMNRCSQESSGWEMVTSVFSYPWSDHTSLPSGSGDQRMDAGYFMHASTISGQEGDSAWLETHRMSPKRECNVQCLQFYYYHSGNESDCLNIWIREFEDEMDLIGTRRLMGQITGQTTFHWQIQHVSLNATKQFQVEFEVRKGAGKSSGGFSIDDINLSELECPHVTMQINNFERLMRDSVFGQAKYSERYYSSGGYAYAVGLMLFETYFGLFVQLLSGDYDDQLEWPCPQRQVSFKMVDQNPNIQQQMSKERSITSDLSVSTYNGVLRWGNPRYHEDPYVDENNETIYAGPLLGRRFFADLYEIRTRDFLKGGNAVFVFSFQDITPLLNGSALPCPQMRPVEITHPPADLDNGPCTTGVFPTTSPPKSTTHPHPKTTTHPHSKTTTHPHPKTTTHPHPETTTHPHPETTTHPHPETTTHPHPETTIQPLPKTTDDDSVFGFSAGLVCSPVLTLLLALMLLIR